MARKDLVLTVVRVDGKNLGEFREFTGGGLTSTSTKNVRAAGETERARGGRQSVENVTVTREDDGRVDLKQLAGRRGKAPMEVDRIPLDEDGNPKIAQKITYTGILLNVMPGEGDAGDDGGDLDDFSLELDCDGQVS